MVFFNLMLAGTSIIFGLTIITYVKVLVNWLPKRFRIVQTLLSYFIDAQTILLIIWMSAVFMIPTILSWIALLPYNYSYDSVIYGYVKIMAMSTGGWLLESATHIIFEENLAQLLNDVETFVIIFIVYLSQLVGMIVTGV